MNILGIWDGHDAGACIVSGEKILVAINEERITKRKLDVGFPKESIKACLKYANLRPSDISAVAASTSDFAKTLTRYLPALKDNYYLFRRRKTGMPLLQDLRRGFKYRITEIGASKITKKLSEMNIRKQLVKLGFRNFRLHIVEHHLAHAASAAYTSGFNKSLVITLDGIGDGLSGTVNIFDNGKIERISSISGRDSLGIFYEQATSLLNMRELEDEGKVMALAGYSNIIPESKNRMADFFEVKGMDIKSKHNVIDRYKELKKILWNSSPEQFAYMTQSTLEKHMVQLFKNCVDKTSLKDVCWAGGVASNIKANRKVLPYVKKWHIFPHMGDGGLAIGAALYCNYLLNNIKGCELNDVYLGPDYDESIFIKKIKKNKFKIEKCSDITSKVSGILCKENFVLWFQGRMELGPRALGNRSILAPADSMKIRDELNLKIKQRSWFQPFCPSLLEEDADKVFYNVKQYDKFMVMGYDAKENAVDKIKAVVSSDNTARPQMLGNENKIFRELLENVKKEKGIGVLLNTSFNLHGYPIVNTPEDAFEVFAKTQSKYLAIGDYLIIKK